MPKVRVHSIGVSLDGFSSADGQSLEEPFGPGGKRVMDWFFPTDVCSMMWSKKPGEKGVDNAEAVRGFENLGAYILGRNMFGPIRGPWPNEEWKGWWGPNPPYHVPTFILTHHARDPIEMEGGTTFYFVTEGIEAALDRAKKVAGSKDVRIGGGATTIRQYLKAGLVDEANFVLAPVLLGSGESPFAGVDLVKAGYEVTRHFAGERGTHLTLTKRP